MRLVNGQITMMEQTPKHQICTNILNKKIPGLKIMGDLNKAYWVNYKQKVGTIICKQKSEHSKQTFVFSKDDNPTVLSKTFKPMKYTLTQIKKKELKSGDLYFGFSEQDIIWHHNYWGLNVNTFVEEYIKNTRWLDMLFYIGNDYSLAANSITTNRIIPNRNKYFIRINTIP